jgi:phosphoribosylformylglycinamidine synthase
LIISAFAPVVDTRQTTTPLLQIKDEQGQALDTEIVLIDLGRSKSRMAGSILSQVIDQAGQSTPDLDDPEDLKNLAKAIISMRRQGLLLAYHDRSDGGLFAAATEMAFTSHVGVSLNVDMLVLDKDHESDFGDAKNWAQQVSGRRNDLTLRALFNEELGALIQVKREHRDTVFDILKQHNLYSCSHVVAKPNTQAK